MPAEEGARCPHRPLAARPSSSRAGIRSRPPWGGPCPWTRLIAADSGLAGARRLGLGVDLVVGDMDSVDPAELAAAATAGARVERHPAAKDSTDMALALDAALELAPTAVTVVGGADGRLDHLLAGVLLLAADRYAAVPIVARMGPATITVVRGAAALAGRVGDVVSLLAVHGPAEGVTTAGLRFPLAAERLEPGSTRGVSTELTAGAASVRLDAGVVLAIQSGESDSPSVT